MLVEIICRGVELMNILCFYMLFFFNVIKCWLWIIDFLFCLGLGCIWFWVVKWWYIKFKCLNCEESWELLIEFFIKIIVIREFDV